MRAVRFELKAVRHDGVVSLDYQALDERDAVQQAQSQGYTVLTVRPSRTLASLWPGFRETFPLVLFSQELLVLLDAGLPLVESIETLAEKERKRDIKTVLMRIAGILRQGQTFSSALQQFPEAFPTLYVATIRASEKTGSIGQALGRYVAYQTQLEAVRKRLMNASIYPVLLMLVGGLVSLFLLVYVVPKFSHIYEERSVDLPLFSQLLIGWGRLLEGHGLLVMAVLGGFLALAVYVSCLKAVRSRIAAILWRIPAVGDRLRVYQLARFYRTLGMLLRGGMAVVPALDLASGLLHAALREGLTVATRAISEGQSFSQSMEQNGLTTGVALRMLIVGEQGGNMGEMMERAAAFHEEEVARWVDWFSRLFEPLLMAFIGVAIGIIVILMYLPIFELAGNLR